MFFFVVFLVFVFEYRTRTDCCLSQYDLILLITRPLMLFTHPPTHPLTHWLAHLQAWCKRWGVPLLWAPCATQKLYSCPLDTSHPRQAWRFLDPGVANISRLNVTVTAEMTDVSARLWSAVETLPANASKEVRAIV